MSCKYNTMYYQHLKAALTAAGKASFSLLTSVAPDSDRAVAVRDFKFSLSTCNVVGLVTEGTIRTIAPLRMKYVLLRTLDRIKVRLTRWQQFRFWLYVWWAQLRGEFWYG